MSFDDKQINRLKQLLSLLEPDVMTNTEFLKQYENVINQVKKVERQLLDSVKLMEDKFSGEQKELKGKYDLSIGDVKKIVSAEIKSLKESFSRIDRAINIRLNDIKNGEDGKDADEKAIANMVMEEIEIPSIDDLAKKLPNLGEDIRNALELLKGDERIEISAINNLEEKLEELGERITKSKRIGGTGGMNNAVQYADLTSQCDGATKTFTVPSHRMVVQLSSTQFPIIFRPVVDFTSGNKTITLTDEVSAPEAGQTLTLLYIK